MHSEDDLIPLSALQHLVFKGRLLTMLTKYLSVEQM